MLEDDVAVLQQSYAVDNTTILEQFRVTHTANKGFTGDTGGCHVYDLAVSKAHTQPRGRLPYLYAVERSGAFGFESGGVHVQ